MKLWVIGHPEAVLGFSLVGVYGIPVGTVEEMNKALDLAIANQEVGIVLITDDCADLERERVNYLMQHKETPIFLEIPNPQGMKTDHITLTQLVNHAIGIQ